MRFSLRSSIHATARRKWRAAQTATTYSGTSAIFWPNAPPTSGATTRRSASGMPRHVGEPGAQHVRHLHRGGERHPAGRRIEGGMRAARLQRQRALAARADFDLDHLGGTRERGGRAGVDPPFDQDVAGGIRVHERRAGASAESTSTTASSGSSSTATCSARSSASRGRGGDHGGDRLADVADPIRRKDRLLDGDVVGPVQQRPDRSNAGKVCRREHGGAARPADSGDPAAGDRAAHEMERRGARREVRHEAAAAGDQRGVLEARNRTADPAHGASARSRARFVITRTRSRR